MIKKVSIITPYLNEEENVGELCRALDEYARGKSFKLEIVFVDDGSTDNTSEKIRRYKFLNADAKVVILSKNYGSHSAIRAGIQNATADYCMFFSADLQEPVEMIGEMVAELEKGFDFVCARKKSTKTGVIERAFSYLYSLLIRKFAVKSFPFGGVNNILFNSKIKENLNKQIERNSSIFLQIIDMGYKMSIIDVSYIDRKKGRSKWTFGKRVKLLIDSFVAFSYLPIRLVSIMGIILFVLGLFVAFVTVVIKSFDVMPLALGWPTLISIVSIGFGITNISLGIIAEYLWRTLDYSRNGAAYFVDEVINVKVKSS